MPGLRDGPATAPLPVLFLMADTGGGHRNAARAVGESLELAYPGRFTPVLCDPLGGPGSARLLRWVTRLYGPAVRLAPWLWGAAYYATNARPAMWLLQRTLLRPADRVAAGAGQGAPARGDRVVPSAHRHGRSLGAGSGRTAGARGDRRHRPGHHARGLAVRRR